MPPSTEPAPKPVAPPAPLDESLVGKRVNKYEVVGVIGRGGMGVVYEAINTAIGKHVAMKFVEGETARNKDAVARFQREAEAASAVESAHIIDIFDSGIADDGRPYIVMELLRGEDLGHRIKRCGRLELGEALHVTAQILRGLHRAHEAGIVHRDLKPDNVFLVDRDDDPNFAKILDFGISKVQRQGTTPVATLTRQGTVLGTPFYMSPEQAQALGDIDGRTDLWSVGAILYECLTGRPPHSGSTYEQVIVNICMNDADDVRTHNPGVPPGIAHVLAKALARDRTARFASAREFLDGLKAVSGGMIASRTTTGSDGRDDSAPGLSSNDFRLTPRVEGSVHGNASDAGGTGAFGPTLEVQSGGSKVGWSTNGKRGALGDQRTFFLVAGSALVAGALVAFLFVRNRDDAEATTTTAARAAAMAPQEAQTATSAAPATATATATVVVAPTATGAEPSSAAPEASAKVEPGDAKSKATKSGRAGVGKPTQAAPATTGVGGQLKLKTE